MMVRTAVDDQSAVNYVQFDLGHTAVYDDRVNPNQHTPGHASGNFACDQPRLPIGVFYAGFSGKVC